MARFPANNAAPMVRRPLLPPCEGQGLPPWRLRKPRTCGGITTNPYLFSSCCAGSPATVLSVGVDRGHARRCQSDRHGSENETDAGHNEQRVDDEFELSIRESFEDAQSEPRAEQGGRNESERLPVQLRCGRR